MCVFTFLRFYRTLREYGRMCVPGLGDAFPHVPVLFHVVPVPPLFVPSSRIPPLPSQVTSIYPGIPADVASSTPSSARLDPTTYQVSCSHHFRRAMRADSPQQSCCTHKMHFFCAFFEFREYHAVRKSKDHLLSVCYINSAYIYGQNVKKHSRASPLTQHVYSTTERVHGFMGTNVLRRLMAYSYRHL